MKDPDSYQDILDWLHTRFAGLRRVPTHRYPTFQIWLVVEKMRELGWELTLQTRKDKWSVRISKGIVAHAENDNLCRAILLAGKKFMEMEEEIVG